MERQRAESERWEQNGTIRNGKLTEKSISRDTTGTLLQDDLNLLLQTPPLLV